MLPFKISTIVAAIFSSICGISTSHGAGVARGEIEPASCRWEEQIICTYELKVPGSTSAATIDVHPMAGLGAVETLSLWAPDKTHIAVIVSFPSRGDVSHAP